MEEAGSVDEQSTKSDEEYNDLAMRENGYWSDDEQQTTLMKQPLTPGAGGGDDNDDDDNAMKKADNNLNQSLEMGNDDGAEMPCAYPLTMNGGNRDCDAKARRRCALDLEGLL